MKIWTRALSVAAALVAGAGIFTNSALATNAPLDADVTRVSASRRLEIGKSARVTVEVTNEGYADWAKTNTKLLADIYQGPSGRGANLPELVEFVEARRARHSGDRWTFTYNITGPKAPGTYTLAWQMANKGRKFGSFHRQQIEIYGTNIDAKIHEGDIRYRPNPVKAGKRFSFTVVVNNVGDVPFATFRPQLRAKVMRKPRGAATTSLEKAFPTRLFKPNGKKWTFRQFLQAPKTEGAYIIRWQMYRGSSAIGESADKTINVIK